MRGGQAEGALDDHVVDRHEVDLRLAVARLAREPGVRVHQRLVEDLAERIAEHLARARDVGGDRRGIGDHLVLEAGVELHVPDLVDELRREEGALLLVVLGQDEAAELGRDPLLGDHQRAQDPVEEVPFAVGQRFPVGAVALQVDVLRRPVGVLPVEVERLRVLESEQGHAPSQSFSSPNASGST